MNLIDLKNKISKIDGKGYKNYKSIEGKYEIKSGFILHLVHAQGDPFASPSKINLIADIDKTYFPEDLFNNFPRRLALQDYLLRNLKKYLSRFSKNRGTGKSGLYIVKAGGQEVILRSGCEIIEDKIFLRFFCGLPAFGRKINGKAAIEMLTNEIPSAIKILNFNYYDKKDIYGFVNLVEDIEFIRGKLREKKLIAFIGNGSILPRESGISEKPLKENFIPFSSPETLEVEFNTLHNGKIKGMGIPEGITLIVGGGFHGKSTLLNAISKGIYPHIKGDGREWVITDPSAVKVRSEDGRFVKGVDISPFISNLPMGKSTKFFSTENASGSTSIAASIIEALEVGVKVLLIDEDTTATNFLIRDFRIQKLIPKEKEPITPFIDKIRTLYEKHGVSTIIVIGGSGDYLQVADRVISLENYKIFDRTEKAKKIIKEYPYFRKIENLNFDEVNKREIIVRCFNLNKKIKSRGVKEIVYGKDIIDVSNVEQIIDDGQIRFIIEVLKYLGQYNSQKEQKMMELLSFTKITFNKKGFSLFSKNPPGDLTYTRKFEISAAINRFRNLEVKNQINNSPL